MTRVVERAQQVPAARRDLLKRRHVVPIDLSPRFPLDKYLPYAVTRTWHLQIAIFWIATSWLATGLYVGPAVSVTTTEHAQYRSSPYETAAVGHQGIKDFWRSDRGDPFTMAASIVAVDDPNAVVRVEVQYGEPTNQEYRDLWLLRFADGRVEDFEEWAYWPGKPYAATPT